MPCIGEELVVLLRRQQMLVRPGQLRAQDQRLDAARDQKGESGDDVADADLLVIDRRETAGDARRGFPNLVERPAVSRRGGGDLRRSFDFEDVTARPHFSVWR